MVVDKYRYDVLQVSASKAVSAHIVIGRINPASPEPERYARGLRQMVNPRLATYRAKPGEVARGLQGDATTMDHPVLAFFFPAAMNDP